MKRHFLFLIMVFSLSLGFSAEQEYENQFAQATNALESGEPEEAIEGYAMLLDAGYESAALYYNMGLAQIKKGDMVKARLYMEKALRMEPGMEKARTAIARIKGELELDMYQVPDFFLVRLARRSAVVLSPFGWLVIELLMVLLLIAAVYFWRMSSSVRQRRKAFLSGLGLLLILALTVVMGTVSDYERHRDDIHVLMTETALYQSPDVRSEVERSIPAGVKLRETDRLKGWVYVLLPNREAGWVQAQYIEGI